MTENYVIYDQQLPANQDFKFLKEEALSYIQSRSGNEWTNLNASDPGVTILDQICFALTELGYCNDFSVADILTQRNGNIETENQFYLPEQILTSSPVTLTDYRKFLIDGVTGVRNAIIRASSAKPDTYEVFLLIDSTISNGLLLNPSVPENLPFIAESRMKADQICEASFYYLNRARNLAEYFELPVLLTFETCSLTGQIELEKSGDAQKIITTLQQRINDFIFPSVLPIGYNEPEQKGSNPDDLMNGPRLQNGWISDESLGDIKNKIVLNDIIQLVQNTDGIVSCSLEGFLTGNTLSNTKSCDPGQFIFVGLADSVSSGTLQLLCRGENISAQFSADKKHTLQMNQVAPLQSVLVYGSQVNKTITIPAGKFRDIESYYSIQNTLPEIFGAGTYSIESAASDYQVSQSRQLRGYLTFFDQLLANQFAQLANVDKLFSFKNPMVAATSDNRKFYALKTDFEKGHLEYPVPFKVFAPTYFYRSLYNVPFIRPLLKDYTTFNFSYGPVTEKELKNTSWESYKLDPYNAYIHGLMELMEDDQLNMSRRNALLDHLLARHGESPEVINTLINGSLYSGDSGKDALIFKSLYLQNLGLLSYYRNKAYNYLGANKVEEDVSDRTAATLQQIDSLFKEADFENDFIFSTDYVNQLEKLTEKDFINFSAVELKFCLLFGLRPLYRNFLADVSGIYGETIPETPEMIEQQQLSQWMIEKRRGSILLETNLFRQLLGDSEFSGSGVTAYDVIIILPDFIPQMNTVLFKNRLHYLLENELPVFHSQVVCFVSQQILAKLIPAFVNYHDALIYRDNQSQDKDKAPAAARKLLAILNELTPDSDA